MEDLAELVRQIQVEHRHDKDLGYGAIRAIQSLWRSLEPCRQLALKGVLVGFVLCRERPIWALALEALVQEHAQEVARELLNGVRAGHHDQEWRDDVVLAVLRLEYAEEVVLPPVRGTTTGGMSATGTGANGSAGAGVS